MADNFLAGNIAFIKVSDTGYSFDKWSWSQDIDISEITNFESAPAKTFLYSNYQGKLKVSGPLNQGNMSPFTPGAAQQDIIIGYDTGITVTVPMLVKNLTIDADVKDAQRVSCELWSNGTFSLGAP